MLVPELIRTKRDGGELGEDEISFLVEGIADGSVSDAQVGALAMAIVLRGMSAAERVALTGAMTRSGEVLDWSDAGLPGPALDKHSTGGVGDKVSLLLAPIVAACGGAVPMISGRGLGHTGGTLDKLEAIPGYDTAPDPEIFRRAVAGAGCAIVGQTAALAPADKRLYAIRDATGTVESIPLIVASILSKKLAAGLSALVMDVKVGSGAFLPGREAAAELARSIVEVARGNGLPTSALLTDMDRVLGRTAGNAVEVRESLDHLTGAARDERLVDVTLALSAELLRLGGVEPDEDAARAAAGRALESGAAAERFAAMVRELGGPSDLLEAPDRHLAQAPVTVAAEPFEPGTVARVDVRAVGLAVVALGGGRTRETDPVDHAVGLTEVAAPGEEVAPGGRPLALVHAPTRSPAPGRRTRCAPPTRSATRPPRRAPSSSCCADGPQGGAARPPRGDGNAGARPPARRAQRPSRPRGPVRGRGDLRLHRLPRLPARLRPRRRRDPHRRGLPRRDLRVPGALRRRGRGLRRADRLAGPRRSGRPERRGAPRRRRPRHRRRPRRSTASRRACSSPLSATTASSARSRVARYAAARPASVRGRLPARGRRGGLPRRRLRGAVPDRGRGGPRLQRARRASGEGRRACAPR